MILLSSLQNSSNFMLPEGFTYVTDIIDSVILEPRYFSTYNFVGRRIEGYNSPNIIMTEKATKALKIASDELNKKEYILKIWDGYRPQTAVNYFIQWANDLLDIKTKKYFYPDLNKRQLFELGYIVKHSSHTRGSTIDLTIVDKRTGIEVDMGSTFDLFNEISHHGTKLINKQQTKNRNILKTAMENAGFSAYNTEWWHYTLSNEPFPDTYFDFPAQ